jgi:hypothetical protein
MRSIPASRKIFTTRHIFRIGSTSHVSSTGVSDEHNIQLLVRWNYNAFKNIFVKICLEIKFVSDHDDMGLWYFTIFLFMHACTCNQCLSQLTLWVRTPLRRGALDTTLCNKVFSNLRQVGGFLRVLWFPPPIKLTATI